ncbi:MAG: hypothetical protein KDJ19_05080 [Hyphomicrobiaceae bacterium]|nr:hypothetical protein [Hyphomicrobiaceae bacterium]MCC0024900.1 hypothetical protein [Hyphomicrobiaceae bacterium]
MATFLVINTNDSGAGSLRDAIEAAAADPDADTIKFASWLSGETIFLQDTLTIESGTVTINGDINGDGDPDVIISGDAGDDGKSLDDVGILLQVRSGANATIQSMHFTEAYAKGANGSGYSGGGTAIAGISNQGDLRFFDSVLQNAQAFGGDGASSTIYARHGGDGFAGIYNSGTAYIRDSLLTTVFAYGGDGADGTLGGDGGNATAGFWNFGTLRTINAGMSSFGAFAGAGGDSSTSADGGDGGNSRLGILNYGSYLPLGPSVHSAGGASFGLGGTSNGGQSGANGTFLENFAALQATYTSGFSQFGDVITVPIAQTFMGLAGADRIDNSGGSGKLYGGSGNDYILTNGANVKVQGGLGDDFVRNTGIGNSTMMYGGKGNDTLQLDNVGRNFTLNLLSGNAINNSNIYGFENIIGDDDANFTDRITGDNSRNILIGRKGADILKGMNGDDQLFGGDQDDKLFGGNDDDHLFGGNNNDSLQGNDGNDLLFGENGKDLLDGGRNDDQLVGGGNNDQFKFGKGYDRDVVMDFQDNIDTLVINDNLWKGTLSRNQVLIQFATLKNNGDVVLNFGNGDIFKIKDVGSVDALKNDMTIV